jgi:hypothetical protein
MHSYSVLSSRWKILAALLLPGIVHASDQLLTVARGTDVLNVWRADQHLYVKGDIGVSPALLHDLEKWLDRNGTNWTILLAQNAAGESYTDATGATFTGMDAVENALGQGLPNRTAFGQLTEPLTGEPNAAYFILFLQERKFSYYGSTAQDRRALGEDQWQGNLDRPAIAAMRSGGRIIDAVKDTVGNINDRLTQKIRSDQRQRERQAAQAEEAKQRAQQRAETELASAQEALTRLAAAGSAVPILLPLQLQWTNAQTLLAGNDPVRAATEATKTRQAAEAALRSLDELERAPELFRKLESSLARQRQRPHWQAGQVQLGQAEKSLAAAKVAAEEGRLEFSIHGQAAERSLDAAERVIIQAAKLQQIRRVLLMAGGGALALLAWPSKSFEMSTSSSSWLPARDASCAMPNGCSFPTDLGPDAPGDSAKVPT